MKKIDQWFKYLSIASLAILSSCVIGSVGINRDAVSIALVDEVYDEYFDLDTNWNDFFNYDIEFYWSDGELPIGIELTDSGRLIGVPRQTGSFDFEVEMYSIDYDGYTDFSDYIDSTWLTLFVTERSTNNLCPAPNVYSVSELYLCLGKIDEETVDEDDTVSLDVNFYVNPDLSASYAIDTIIFDIDYDADAFTLNTQTLNSSTLREAATTYDAIVTYNADTDGHLTITLESQSSYGFRRSGRLMDIPLIAKKDLDLDSYDFALSVSQMTSSRVVTLPSIVALDGRLDVDEPAVVE